MPTIKNDVSEEEIFEIAVLEGTMGDYDSFEVSDSNNGPVQEYEIFIVSSVDEF